MQVSVGELLKEPGSSLQRSFRPTPEELAFEEIELADKPVYVEIDIQNAGGMLIGTLTVECELRIECARCLEPGTWPVSGTRRIQYMVNPTPDALEAESNEWFVTAYDGETIVIDEDVRQSVMLALPMRFLCGDECRGLCPKCGSNLNAGPCPCPPPQPIRSGEPPFQSALKDLLRKKKE